MMKALLAVLLALLFIGAHSQADQAVFAFSWFEGHCQYSAQTGAGTCDPKLTALWDHQSFTIHGLWPTTKTTNGYGAFDLAQLQADKALFADMQNYWPPQSLTKHNTTSLWEHEWYYHGSDYAALLLRLRPTEFQGLSGDALNKKLQFAFFRDVVAFYKQFRATYQYPSSQLTKDSFAGYFGIKIDEVTFSCVKAFTVREIKICFDLTATGHTMKTCSNLVNQGCKTGTNFELPGWAVSKQVPVFNAPPFTLKSSEL